jgi:DDE superfamily endonuclease
LVREDVPDLASCIRDPDRQEAAKLLTFPLRDLRIEVDSLLRKILDTSQGYLKLPNGRALSGQSHDYKRHGTPPCSQPSTSPTARFAPSITAAAGASSFSLDFMNRIVAELPKRQIHVILDNLNTHKPKQDRWLRRHPNVHFHFTPTRASWLNQIEIWFSILTFLRHF